VSSHMSSWRGVFCASAFVISGCTDAPGNGGPVQEVLIRDAVTAEAAGALDSTGHFVIQLPRFRYPSIPSIDSIRARQLATGFLTTFWNGQPDGLREAWPLAHGAPLNLIDLIPCGPIRVAATPVAASVDDLDYAQRRNMSEYWILRFCDGVRGTAGYIGVSAYATDVGLQSDTVHFPPFAGGEFQDSGLPSGFEEAVRYSPESSAILAYKCSGRRVAAVPRLVAQYGAGSLSGEVAACLGGSRSVSNSERQGKGRYSLRRLDADHRGGGLPRRFGHRVAWTTSSH
jgi:hypothetical protein